MPYHDPARNDMDHRDAENVALSERGREPSHVPGAPARSMPIMVDKQ
jgi:hypothetical protein